MAHSNRLRGSLQGGKSRGETELPRLSEWLTPRRRRGGVQRMLRPRFECLEDRRLLSVCSGPDNLASDSWLAEETTYLADSADARPIVGIELSSAPDVISLRYDLPSLLLQPTGESVEGQAIARAVMPGTSESFQAGEAILPLVPVEIVLPYGYSLGSIDVTVGDRVTLPGSYVLEQYGEPVAIDLASNSGGGSELGAGGKSSESLFEYVGIQKQRGVNLLLVNLSPVQYAEDSGEVGYYTTLTLNVSLTDAEPAALSSDQAIRYRADEVHPLETEVANPGALATYVEAAGTLGQPDRSTCDPLLSFQYVAITSQAMVDATTDVTIHDLIAYKQFRGMSATVVTLEDIYADYAGADHAEQIRNFITDAYNSWETDFVLLGGDADVLPYRSLWVELGETPDAQSIPSDLYYQCLDGGFDGNGNGYWGEPDDGVGGGDVDLFPEVYIGRAAAGNAAEMANFVYKTILYEETASSPYRRNAMMVGEYLGFGGVSEYATASMEEIRLGSSSAGYTTEGFASDPTFTTDVLYDSPTYTWTPSELTGLFNSGDYGIYNHLGHANTSYVMKLYNGDVDALTNVEPFFIYSQGCYPGDFPNDSIAEHFTTSTRYGAAAVVFNSRYGWGVYDGTDGASQRPNREFWDALFGEDINQLGVMNADSHTDVLWGIASPYIRWVVYESNLFGDPAAIVATSEWIVVGSSPADGEVVTAPPTEFVVTFSEPYSSSTVDADDLVVNSVTADSFELTSDYSITFHYDASPVTTQGLQGMSIAADAIQRASDDRGNLAWNASFRYDSHVMAVTSTDPPDGSSVTLPFNYLELNFDEDVDSGSIGLDDLALSQGSVSSAAAVDADTVGYVLTGITTEATLTFYLAAGAVTDTWGNPGAAYAGSLALDVDTMPYPTPLTSVAPKGSLIYDPSVSGAINPVGDADSYTIDVDGGQTITVTVEAAAGLQATVRLLDPDAVEIGYAQAAAAGQDAVLQTITAAASGTYTVVVGETGGTSGAFTARVILNAAVEDESHDGADNNAVANAQDLSASFIDLGGGVRRGAVMGTTDGTGGYEATPVSYAFEDISASGTPILANVDDSYDLLDDTELGSFAFSFYETTYSALYVSSNGLITFGSGTSTYTNTNLFTAPDQPTIAVLWDDLCTHSAPSTVLWEVRGSGADERLIVQWNNVDFLGGSGGITFQAVLYADSGDILLNYADLSGDYAGHDEGASATVGIKNANSAGADPAVLCYNSGPNAFVGTGRSTLISLGLATEDYYRVDLDAGDSVSFVLDGDSAGITLDLYDAAENRLAAGIAASGLSGVISDFVTPATGVYYVAMGGARGDYRLVVTKSAAFELESNNELAEAQDITLNGTVLGYVGPGSGEPTPLPSVLPVSAPETPLWEHRNDSPSAGLAPLNAQTGGMNGAQPTLLSYLAYGSAYTGSDIWTSFDLDLPQVLNNLGSQNGGLFAGDFDNSGDFTFAYALDHDANTLVRIDTATGATTTIGPASPFGGESWSGMAMDPTDDVMYACSTDVSASSLYTIDLATGAATRIGQITNSPGIISLAVDGTGQIYGHDIVNDSLIRVDKATGAGTIVGPLGFNANFAQGADFDEEQGILYLAAYNGDTGQGELRIANLDTGATTLVGVLGATTPGSAEVCWLGIAAGGGVRDDYYQVSAQAGDMLVVTTTLPADGPYEFQNPLDVAVELFDPTGAPVEFSATGSLSHTATMDGLYAVRVLAENDTAGEYVLSVTGHTGDLPTFAVAGVDLADGARFAVQPATFTVDFNDQVLLSSLQASDLLIDGVPVAGINLIVDGDTVVFDLPSGLAEGPHALTIAAGVVVDLQGTPIEPFSCEFFLDYTPPQVVASSIQEGDVIPAGALVYTVQFSEDLLASNLDPSDVRLVGQLSGTHTPSSMAYDPGTFTLSLVFDGLPEDSGLTLTLLSGNGRFEDLTGHDLDGEPLAWPIPPGPSGDGVDGGDFAVNFLADVDTAPYPAPLTAVAPRGSLIHNSSVDGAVQPAGDVDRYTIDVDGGQTITVVMEGVVGLQAAIRLLDPSAVEIGYAEAPAAGQDVVLQTVPAAASGTYTVIFGAAGGTNGNYAAQVILNAAAEDESHDGAANNDLASAQDLDGSFIGLGSGTAQRAAVQGEQTSSSGLVVTSEDFESGVLGPQWTVRSSNPEGRVRVLDTYGAAEGSPYALLMDRSPDGTYSRNEATWTVDLSGLSQANLTFYHAEWGDEEQSFSGPFSDYYNADGVAISADGLNWYPVWNASNQSAGIWAEYTIDLDAAADAAGIGLGPGFQIRFQQYDDYALTTDGRGYDQIRITTPVPPEDWYRFTLDAGEAVSLALTAETGSAGTLTVYDDSGTLLASGMGGAAEVDQYIDTLIAPAAGTYYAQIEGGEGDYSLVVTRGATFDVGINAGPAPWNGDPAQDITDTQGVLGYSEAGDNWTFMVYMCGDNNLEEAGIDDFLEMASVGSSEQVNIVVQLDRTADYDTRYGDWTGARRGLVEQSDVPDLTWGTDLGEVNMGDPASAADFVEWAVDNYPAQHYALVFWDHGGGFYGVSFDDTDYDDLSMEDLSTTFAAIPDVDLIGFDACLMGMAEIAYQIRDEGSVMVASEETVPWDGFEYQDFLNYLVADPGMSAVDLAGRIIDAYEALYDGYGDSTLSSIDLAGLGSAASGLAGALESFANVMLSSATPSDWTAVQDARNASQAWADYTFRDLGDFMARVQAASVAPAIVTAAADVSAALAASVLRAYGGSSVTSSGLAVYLPGVGDGVDSYYYNDTLRFVADTQWEDFLAQMVVSHLDGPASEAAGIASAPAVDQSHYWQLHPKGGHEETSDASLTVSSEEGGSALSSGEEVGDWYRVSLLPDDHLILQTSTPSGDFAGLFVNEFDPYVELYDASGTLLASDDNALDGRNAFLEYTATEAGSYWVRVAASPLNPLSSGEYFLSVEGASGARLPFEVVATDPGDGWRSTVELDTFTIDFNDAVFLSSLQAADLMIDGTTPAAAIHQTPDGDTVIFELPAGLAEGWHTATIGAGVIADVQGTPIEAFSSQFCIDLTPPRVVGSSIQEGDVLPDGDLTCVVAFSEAILASNLDAWDVSLVGQLSGQHAPSQFNYDPATHLLTLEFQALPEDLQYTLTLHSGNGGFEDLAGNDLDGEPLAWPVPPGESGDGYAGGDFVVHFTMDQAEPEPLAAWERIAPLGGLMASGWQECLANFGGDADTYTLFAEAGENLTAVAYPDDPAMTLTIELIGLTGPITGLPGAPAVVPSTPISADGTYAVRVTADMAGTFQLKIGKNLAFEVTDTADGSELAMDDTLVSLGSGRFGVVGTSQTLSVEHLIWAVQPATGKILQLDSTTGVVVGSFDAPDALAPGHTHIGLSIAENGDSLLYVNSDVDPSALYRLDPVTGAVLSIESTAGLIYDGLGYESIAPILYSADMDTNPGWTFEGSWAWGMPTGGGSHNYDPTSGYTGANVIGYNLNGDYVNYMPVYYATTPALDASQYANVTLSFQRWLGVESSSYDHANIQVSNDGSTWTTVWNHTSSAVSESSWSLQTYDISAVADGQATVYIRWGMGPTDGSVTYPGWNIDDVVVTGDFVGSTSSVFLDRANAEVLRQDGFSGAETSHYTLAAPWGAIGGDDQGRQFVYVPSQGIVEYDPVTPDTVIRILPAPAADIEGMAFDGTSLYVSTASGDLFTLDPDTGDLENHVVVVGGGLFGLGASAVTGGGGLSGLGASETTSGGGYAYVRSIVGQPWGVATNEDAMDMVFGAGNWDDLRYETVDPAVLFSSTYEFVYMEGSDSNANELEGFLTANRSLIEDYVFLGGTLLLNAGPNEGDGMDFGFGGVTLVYPQYGETATAVDPSHPVFNGPFAPTATSYSGTSFSHACVVGAFSPLLLDEMGDASLAELDWGSGLVVFGGMTTDNYQSPQPQAHNLRANIIDYVSSSSGGGGGFVVPDMDEFTLNMTADQVVDVVLQGQAGADFSGALLELLDCDGVTVATATHDPMGVPAENYDLAILGFSVPHDGVYTLRLTSPVDGEYGIVVTDSLAFYSEPSADPDSDPLRDLTTTNEALGYLGDHWYACEMSAGQYVVISTGTPFDHPANQPWNDLDPEIRVIDPGGATVAWDDNSAADGRNAVVSFTASVSGTYKIYVGVESGEGDYLLSIEDEWVPPTVTGVLVASTAWTPDFLDYLGAAGHAIPDGPDQLLCLPWGNLDKIIIEFSGDVVVGLDDLAVGGVNVAEYTVVDFTYDSDVFTATWTLAERLNTDRISITLADSVHDPANALDGEWEDAASTFPSGNGAPGGDFQFSFNVLPGDANQSGVADDADAAIMAAHWSSSEVTYYGDFNGDGLVDARDASILGAHWRSSMVPPAEASGDGGVDDHDASTPTEPASSAGVRPIGPVQADPSGAPRRRIEPPLASQASAEARSEAASPEQLAARDAVFAETSDTGPNGETELLRHRLAWSYELAQVRGQKRLASHRGPDARRVDVLLAAGMM